MESEYRDYTNSEYITQPPQTEPSQPETARSKQQTSNGPLSDRETPNSLSYFSMSSIPYADGESPTPDRENVTILSSPYSTDTVDTVVPNPQVSTELSAEHPVSSESPQRSVGNFDPLIKPAAPTTPPPNLETNDEEVQSERCDESQRLVQRPGKRNKKRPARTQSYFMDKYQPGSCCYCLYSLPVVVLFLWVALFLAIIGWSIATWRSTDSLESFFNINIRTDFQLQGVACSDLVIIVTALATFLFSVLLLVVSSYTSQELSLHHFTTSGLNRCGYCLTTTMIILSCVAVITWTLIIAFTMIPTATLSLIHALYKTDLVNCLHLPSYGYNMSLTDEDEGLTVKMSTAGVAFDPTNIAAVNASTISYTANVTEATLSFAADSPPTLSCGEDLNSWLTESWILLTPLLISLGFSVLIEMILMGFAVLNSSNNRHLKERMNYLSSGPSEITDDKHKPPFI